MTKKKAITHLFLDIGGVLLTNGWDHLIRKRAAKHFHLQFAEIENRHHLTFEIYEKGDLTLEEYLDLVIFYEKRSFSKMQFKNFMFEQSKALPKMIEYMSQVKAEYGLKIVVVSNEAKELNEYRIEKFKLNHFVDAFISSCFVHLRKPDVKIFHFALDIAQANPQQVIYIENTPMFVEIANGLNIHGILHTDYKSTAAKLASFGFTQ